MNQAESKDLYLRWEELRSLFTVSTYSKGVRLALEAQRQAQSWSVEESWELLYRGREREF